LFFLTDAAYAALTSLDLGSATLDPRVKLIAWSVHWNIAASSIAVGGKGVDCAASWRAADDAIAAVDEIRSSHPSLAYTDFAAHVHEEHAQLSCNPNVACRGRAAACGDAGEGNGPPPPPPPPPESGCHLHRKVALLEKFRAYGYWTPSAAIAPGGTARALLGLEAGIPLPILGVDCERAGRRPLRLVELGPTVGYGFQLIDGLRGVRVHRIDLPVRLRMALALLDIGPTINFTSLRAKSLGLRLRAGVLIGPARIALGLSYTLVPMFGGNSHLVGGFLGFGN
jgi:hypothetical protein